MTHYIKKLRLAWFDIVIFIGGGALLSDVLYKDPVLFICCLVGLCLVGRILIGIEVYQSKN